MTASYKVTDADYDVLVNESRKRLIPAADVALALYIESAGFDPASAGPGGAGGANGLNQLTVSNLKGMGYAPEEWRALSAAEQLPKIFRWWDAVVKDFAGGKFPSDAGQLAALNFLPGRYKLRNAGQNPDAPLTASPESFYAQNVFYDPKKTGAITVNTIRERQSLEAAGARWAELQKGVIAATERANAVPTQPEMPVTPLPPVTPPEEPPAPLADVVPVGGVSGHKVGVVVGLAALVIAAVAKACIHK